MRWNGLALLGVVAACSGDAVVQPAGTGGAGAGGGGAATLTVVLPQAIDGAMFVNPSVYDDVPVHVAVTGDVDGVVVAVGDDSFEATDPDGDGTWTATISTSGRPDGVVELSATASAGDATTEATAELVVGSEGVRLSVFADTGFVGTPRLHRVGDEAWVTFTDRAEPDAEAWMRRIDGGGRWMGERVRLVGATEETLYARVAFGGDRVGILYQAPGSPYVTWFKIVDHEGTETLAPVALDPAGQNGAFGGDIAYDGSGFVVVWRSFGGTGPNAVRWARFDAASGAMTGPVDVAVAGAGDAGDPVGGFDPFSFIGVEALGTTSVVSFVREHYNTALDFNVPKSQLARVSADGALLGSAYVGTSDDYFFHRESRVYASGDGVLALWTAADLLSTTDPAPNVVYGKLTDADGVPSAGTPARVVDHPDDRDEPFFLATPGAPHRGVLMWIDHRAYSLDPPNGRIELYVAPMADDLSLGAEVVFPHARFFAGLAQLNGAVAGTNVPMIWLDTRNGGSMQRELYYDVAWF